MPNKDASYFQDASRIIIWLYDSNYYIATPEARLMQFQCLSILLAAILSEFDLMLFYSQMKTD